MPLQVWGLFCCYFLAGGAGFLVCLLWGWSISLKVSIVKLYNGTSRKRPIVLGRTAKSGSEGNASFLRWHS